MVVYHETQCLQCTTRSLFRWTFPIRNSIQDVFCWLNRLSIRNFVKNFSLRQTRKRDSARDLQYSCTTFPHGSNRADPAFCSQIQLKFLCGLRIRNGQKRPKHDSHQLSRVTQKGDLDNIAQAKPSDQQVKIFNNKVCINEEQDLEQYSLLLRHISERIYNPFWYKRPRINRKTKPRIDRRCKLLSEKAQKKRPCSKREKRKRQAAGASSFTC